MFYEPSGLPLVSTDALVQLQKLSADQAKAQGSYMDQ